MRKSIVMTVAAAFAAGAVLPFPGAFMERAIFEGTVKVAAESKRKVKIKKTFVCPKVKDTRKRKKGSMDHG
ncbi:MAG: hypothetical protein ACPGVU_18040 [Limisphaerales bacterium]